MKQDLAKQLIRSEYLNWKKQQTEINDYSKFHFFNYLQSHQPSLLNFKYSGNDQWQTVCIMLSGL